MVALSKTWFRCVRELVRILYRNQPSCSNWVLSHFRNIEVLNPVGLKIEDKTMLKLTNLKELHIQPGSRITSRGLVNLTSTLRKLEIHSNRILEECLLQLSSLNTLYCGYFVNFSDESLKKLSLCVLIIIE